MNIDIFLISQPKHVMGTHLKHVTEVYQPFHAEIRKIYNQIHIIKSYNTAEPD